jgi:hypothetical protein
MATATALVFMIDRTGSMGPFRDALRNMLPSTICALSMTRVFDYMAVITYSDYDLPRNRVTFSGYRDVQSVDAMKQLQDFTSAIHLEGGAGIEEAVKTCLVQLAREPVPQPLARLHLLHLTDASPHSDTNPDSEGVRERKALGDLFPWSATVAHLRSSLDTLVYSGVVQSAWKGYGKLALDTGGVLVRTLPKNVRQDITAVISTWLGEGAQPEARDEVVAARLTRAMDSMRQDPAVVDRMFADMANLVRVDVAALTVSPILGKLWRDLCARRADARRDELVTAFCTAKNKLESKTDRKALDKFLAASYDRADEIRADLVAFLRTGASRGLVRFTPDSAELCCHKVVQLLADGGRTATATIRAILGRFNIDADAAVPAMPDGPDDAAPELPPRTLPLAWGPERVMTTLLHTVAPGTLLSRRPAALLAMHALDCGSVIGAVAAPYLRAIKGQWINWRRRADGTPEVPENFQRVFVELVARTPDAATEEEAQQARRLARMHAVMGALRMEVDYEHLDTLSADGTFPGHVVQCSRCTHMRALSTITAEGVCAYCQHGKEPAYTPRNPRRVDGLDVADVYQVRCSQCAAFYSRNPDVHICQRSKCPACLIGIPQSTRTCTSCQHAFVVYGELPRGQCGQCLTGQPPRLTTTTKHARVLELYDGEDLRTALCGAAGLELTDRSRWPVQKAGQRMGMALDMVAGDAPVVSAAPPLRADVSVHNPDEVWAHIVAVVQGTQRAADPECSICMCAASEVGGVFAVCGRRGCAERACRPCLQRWYDRNQPGRIVFERATLCQFCARTPSAKVLRACAPLATRLKLEDMPDPSMRYAWCKVCVRVQPFAARACTADYDAAALDAVADFVCETCARGSKDAEARTCPHCTAPTQKAGGCNHMTCVCGGHWCWECGEPADTSEACYGHMWAVHGRIFMDEPARRQEDDDNDLFGQEGEDNDFVEDYPY